MNKRYISGRAKEYRIMKRLKKEGCQIVARSAGSHSAVDVWAIHKRPDSKYLRVYLIQSKPKSMSKNAKEKLYKEYSWLNTIEAHVEFRVE